ncbi:Pentapeptide repeat family protein [Frigoriglobus tundricola]|uniref:Pentapeptide repeat family protein n=1 Tax=Frigoriglobus tundricola TaxID=2774151 RepID=A0A6M5YI16_9BACT|nr:Pentapeptide repeat family protein [Frigoriglobus tundricola]
MSFTGALLIAPMFSGLPLPEANFSGTQFQGGKFDNVDLSGANLSNASLRRVSFVGGTLRGANIAKANFFEVDIEGGDWSSLKGTSQAFNLEETTAPNPPKYFEHCERTWLERWCSWERLRTFGRLPLFGASWSGFAFVALYVYVIAWHNQQVRRISGSNGPQGEWVGRYLHELPIPSLTLLLFMSTVLLAAASTLYSIFCPGRIREFSQEKWCDELRRPLLHYWPLAWKHPRLRLACGLLYVLGAACAIIVVGWKIVTTGRYILENTKLI